MAVIENDVIKVTVSNSSSKNVIRVSPGVAALSSVSISLNELNNVDTSGITNGQTIVYNNGSFVAGDSGAVESINGEFPDAEGDVAIDFSVDGLSDVTAPSPSEGDILKYESNRWVNDSLGKADVGLNNVDNTSDSDKPVSTATQTALDAKANTSAVPVSLNDLSDVSIVGTPTKNTTLLYDETANAFKFQPSFTNRFEDEAENNKQAIVPFVERVYTVKTDGDGIFIDSESDTPTAGKVIKRKIYHKVGFIASGDLIGDYTLVHTFADDIAYSATESVFEGFRDGDTYGTAPFTLIQTWEEVTAAPSFTGLLNETYGSGAEAAYSTRRLNGNVTDCMVIRRASDSTTTTIGFDGSGNIDEADIISFCTGTTCTVYQWLDQSGNGNTATAPSGQEPTIYTGGALVKENGKVAVDFTTSEKSMSNASLKLNPVPLSMFFVAQFPNNSAFQHLVDQSQGVTAGFLFTRTGASGDYQSWYYPDLAGVTWNSTTSTAQALHSLMIANGEQVYNLDGTSGYTGTTAITNNPTPTNDFVIGTDPDNANRYFQGKAQELLFYKADKTDDFTDIESNIGDYFTQNTPLLDTYSGAAAAYSLRLLDSSYVGPAIEVYAGTNGTADIGFNVFGELDTVALAAHCGNQDGTVRTWYDQSGNGVDATQTVSTANQPKIYDGTTGVVTENGKPAVEFDGTGYYLEAPDSSTLSFTDGAGTDTYISAFATFKLDSAATNSRVLFSKDDGSPNREYAWGYFGFQSEARFFLKNQGGNDQISQDATTPTQLNLYQVGAMLYDASETAAGITMHINGVASTMGNPVTATYTGMSNTTAPFRIGAQVASNFFSGIVQEIIMYGSDQSAYRTNIESNIATFYDITI